MDITLFLESDETKAKGNNINVNSEKRRLLKSYINIINELCRSEKINIRDHIFLLEYGKRYGSLINVNKFVDLVRQINIDKFNKVCLELFSRFFDGEIEFDTEYIVETMIKEARELNGLTFTKDQRAGVKAIVEFLSSKDRKVFGLYGYAGTGKTTTMVEALSFLLKHGYIKTIAMTAPTNKAVNIMKSKMRNNLKDIIHNLSGKEYGSNCNIDEILDQLADYDVHVDFMTIHRLLNYKNDYSSDGNRIFVKSGNSLIGNYDLVIVDECSMIPLQIIIHLFEDVRGSNKKVIFSGDNIQLPPVNEKKSVIFIKNKADLDYTYFNNTITELDKMTVKNKIIDFVPTKKRYELLTNEITKMEFIILREVMRNRIGNVVKLCYHIREWVDMIVKVPKLINYKGEGVTMYVYNKKKHESKITTPWYYKFIEYQTIDDGNTNSNIILTWTNNQTDIYNEAIRKVLLGKEKLEKFEIGDILMLGEFYNFDEKCVKGKDSKNKFYTSEQIKVMDREERVRDVGEFVEMFNEKLLKVRGIDPIMVKYKALINSLNSKTYRSYRTYVLHIQRLTDAQIKDIIPEIYQINVIHETSQTELDKDKETSATMIRKFRMDMAKDYKDFITKIDKELVRLLWRQWNKLFVDQFANVNYGNSHSVHKSQGSSFFNVFVDTDDILNNPNEDEAKRCIYTAFTRASNELHLLI